MHKFDNTQCIIVKLCNNQDISFRYFNAFGNGWDITPIWNVDFNTLRPRQNGRHFADDTFNHIRISIKFSLKFVLKGPINNILALVQIMAWSRPGDKPLSEAVMVSLLTHICATRPRWVNSMMRCMLLMVILNMLLCIWKLHQGAIKNLFILFNVTSNWARWRLKSPASRLFVQTQIKENIKASRHWPFWGESTGHRWIPLTKGQ